MAGLGWMESTTLNAVNELWLDASYTIPNYLHAISMVIDKNTDQSFSLLSISGRKFYSITRNTRNNAFTGF